MDPFIIKYEKLMRKFRKAAFSRSPDQAKIDKLRTKLYYITHPDVQPPNTK